MSSWLTYGVGMKLAACLTAVLAVAGLISSPGAAAAATAPPRCTIKAPVTAAGYTAMFAHVNPTVWGAADTALTVHLSGRVLWLFSDTPRAKPGGRFDILADWAGMTHSSAIMQTSGCLHVSPGQVLPNDTRQGTYYWIDSARAVSATQVVVNGYELRQGAPWWSAHTGRFRAGLVSIDPFGNVRFQRWLGYIKQPPLPPVVKDGGWLGNSVSYHGKVILDHILTPPTAEYTYSPQLHPGVGLASGKNLLSLAVGWAAGTPTWQQARPIFREVTLR